ncbi:MAG: GMP synthase [Desulfuromonas sp.]|nr:MAG: GMP synthase [Desulfuromonas sp.]
MRKLLIIKCGSTIPELVARKGDFEDWIISGTGLDRSKVVTVNVEQEEPLAAPDEFSGVIITGSHAMVTDHLPWSEETADWLRQAHNRIPILGICYGHQLLGYALGGRVADNPEGREMGTMSIRFTAAAAADRLLSILPESIQAQTSHQQSLIELPPQAILLGQSEREPHHAFRIGQASWGVQFHPEFDADITRTYIDFCAELLQAEGQNPATLKAECRESGAGHLLLQGFAGMLI